MTWEYGEIRLKDVTDAYQILDNELTQWAYGGRAFGKKRHLTISAAIREILDAVYQPIHRCERCGRLIHWIDCPTGGWWSHFEHPSDDHDAIAGGPALSAYDD